MNQSFLELCIWSLLWIIFISVEIVGSLGNAWSLITLFLSGTRLKHFKLYFYIAFFIDFFMGLIFGFNQTLERIVPGGALWIGLENLSNASCKIMMCVLLID